jgi:signal transduction histidine kinase/putative methionine-R-sulfoxide reductase with GAF domain
MPSDVSIAGPEHDREPTFQQLKRELADAREQQAATAEILRAISGSPMDLRRVFASVASSAARLCDAYDATIFQVDGQYLHRVAQHGPIPQDDTLPLIRGVVTGRAVLDREPVHVTDVQVEAGEYPEGSERARRVGHRTILAVPLLHAGVAIGVIAIRRMEVRAFGDRQIELLKIFADQAVIAIENTRLFEAEQASKRELQESLEYQTATSDVLNVISRSPTNVQPVFDTIAQAAAQLCKVQFCHVFRFDGQLIHFAASHGQPQKNIDDMRTVYPILPGRVSAAARSILTGTVEEIPDIHADPEYQHGYTANYRSIVAVPVLKDSRPVGAICMARAETGSFPERQVELLRTFADQAVIAIENTRLFEEVQARTRELSEALERQTATSDVLNVMSRSAFHLQPVLDTIVKTASRLCEAEFALIYRPVDGKHQVAASNNASAAYVRYASEHPIPPGRGSLIGRTALECRTVHLPDCLADPDFTFQEYQAVGKFRTMLGVPLLREGVPIGVIALMRAIVEPFTDKQIELVTTFADQAVIAIENTRLFEEIARKSRELEIASQHKSQFVANMSHELRTPLAAILGYAELMQEGFYEPLGQKSMDALTRIRSNGKHLLGLINTVLDIAKIESGQFTLNMAEYDIDSVVETVRSATESLAQNKKLALKTEVAKSLPVGLGDEQRLTQVLLNLVGNAIKFTDTGEVRVTAKAVNGHFNVSVTDTGPGIPVEHQARIFDQFHQVDSSNTKAKGGTGLGLAIAKQIVEMHGGRIWVESNLGKGSTFQMELPTRAEFRKRS